MYRVFLVILLLVTSHARAQNFLDCSGKLFVDKVRVGFPAFTCAEIGRVSPGGLPVRFVRDAGDKTVVPEAAAIVDAMATIVKTVQKASQLWGAIVPLKLREVTFVIGSPATPLVSRDWGRFRGLVISPGEASDPPECIALIDLNRVLEKSATTPENYGEDLAFVAAHEYAHCVQRWNYAWSNADTSWWVEGIASLLGSVVSPGAATIFNDEKLFLQKAADQPLSALSYETVLFWQWLWNADPAAVFGFMAAVPKAADTTVERQEAALRKLLGGIDAGSRLADFAQKLADNGIPNAAGGLPGKLLPGPALTVSDTLKQPVPGLPLTVQLHPVVVTGGKYLLTVTGALGGSAVKREGETEWSPDFPLEVGSNDCDATERYVMATMRASKDIEIALDAHKYEPCHKPFVLSGPLTVDPCVVGPWTVDNDARRDLLISWIGKDGTVSRTEGALQFLFQPDNEALLTATGFAADVTSNTDPPADVHVGIDGKDAGQWSAADGVLQYKSGRGAMLLDITVSISGLTMSLPGRLAFEDGNWAYTCGDTLELRYTGPSPVQPGRAPVFRLQRGVP